MRAHERAAIEERLLIGVRPSHPRHDPKQRLRAVGAASGAAVLLELPHVLLGQLRESFAREQADDHVAVDATRVDLGRLHAARRQLGAEAIDASHGVSLR